MNVQKLKVAEHRFFSRYPNGWESEEMKPIKKKHKVGKMDVLAQEVFHLDALDRELEAMDTILKFITKSSIVSVFEKVKFKNLINESDDLFKRDIVGAIRTMLHEDEELGFNRLVGLLSPYKMAKWPIVTMMLMYYRPTTNPFVKPTTVKRIIQEYELDCIPYSPKMNYAFYDDYRRAFVEMTTHVDPQLSISYGHFSGFLMMTFE